MTKATYISLILLLILLVTLVNLFYKPWIYEARPRLSQFFQRQFASPMTRSTCALYGLKCKEDELCDCDRLCSNGEFVPFRVLPHESIVLMNRHLKPGTYCLPKGIGSCNPQTSYHVFSLSGWKCVNKNTSLYQDEAMVACKAAGAQDNDLNVLWDYLNNKPAQDVQDPYETLQDGTLRYRCACDSLDMRSQPMMSVLPFMCSLDYCIKDIQNPLPVMGYQHGKCECGPYPHQDPNDETSPCVMERQRIENDEFVGAVRCMTEDAWLKSPIFCPSGEGVLTFTTPVMGDKQNDEFVASIISKI